ncbi:hypothetical protein E2562_030025, partial [Oryza meyeriana var. granulata]
MVELMATAEVVPITIVELVVVVTTVEGDSGVLKAASRWRMKVLMTRKESLTGMES